MNAAKLLNEELSGSNAKAYVSKISEYHRIQGSTMYHDASLYLVRELRSMGFRDVQILQFPADGKRMYWMQRSTPGWTVRSAELRMLEPRDELIARFEDVPVSLHSYSEGTPKDGVEAELVDVGIGTSSKDYRGRNVKGKIVLAKGNAHSVHIEAVVKRGAAGVVTDTLAYEFSRVRQSVDVPDARAYQGIWPNSDNARKITFGFSVSKRVGEALRSLLVSGKKVKLLAKVDAKLFPGKYDIITTTIKGSSKPDEEMFLIAHLCHPKPAANDNASGSGALLEIARTLSALVSSGRIERPARTIRFLWVPETTGTAALLSTRPDMRNRFVAGLNLDMVGEDQVKCGSTMTIGLTPDTLPSFMNDLVVWLFEEMNKELDPHVQIGLPSNYRFARTVYSSGSDHAEFVEAGVGIPCVSLTQWPDKFYHTSMDTIDYVSEDSMRRACWVSAMGILKLANSDAREAHELANLTYARGAARVSEALGKASEELFNAVKDSKSKDRGKQLAKAIAFHRHRIGHVVRREQGAVKSVRLLSRARALDTVIAHLVDDLAVAGERELARLEETAGMLAGDIGIRMPKAPKETASEKEAKGLVPRKLFKGTIGWSDVRDLLDEKALEAYNRIDAVDSDFISKTAELLNLIDGKRSVHEIALELSAEYAATDPVHVTTYLRDLERIGLAKL